MSTSSFKRSENDTGKKVMVLNSLPSTGEANSMPGMENASNQPLGIYYPLTSCYDYHYPGYNGTLPQSDEQNYFNMTGGSYTGVQPDNTSLLYYFPAYDPYNTPSEYVQQPCSYGPESFPCYTYDLDHATSGLFGPGSVSSVVGPTGSGNSSKNSTFPFASKFQQTSSSQSRSAYQNNSVNPLNKFGSNFQSKDFHSKDKTSRQFESKVKNPVTEFTSNLKTENVTNSSKLPSEAKKHAIGIDKSKYIDSKEFQTDYANAKFFVIKSYSEDDIHKSIKYGVWSSTLNGNKKLHAAFSEAEANSNETGVKCPVFLFFSVNASGQFVGVAEMIGQVDFNTDMDFWQLDKWNGFFPVKWHIIKDTSNVLFRDIILVNNDNRPVTYSRDTQEIGLKQGLEMLRIFKGCSETQSILDDFGFYENREKALKAKREARVSSQKKKGGEGVKDVPGPSSVVSLVKNLRLE